MTRGTDFTTIATDLVGKRVRIQERSQTPYAPPFIAVFRAFWVNQWGPYCYVQVEDDVVDSATGEVRYGKNELVWLALAGGASHHFSLEEPKAFALKLVSKGVHVIDVIKLIRVAAEIGLKDAKDIVDSLGTLPKTFTRDEARGLAKAFAEVGAKVDIVAAPEEEG